MSVYLFRPAVITDGLTLTIDFFHAILCLSDEGFLFFIGRLQIINLLFQFFRRSDVMLFQEDDRLRDCIDVVTLSPHLIAFALSGAQLAFDVDQPLDLTFGIISAGNFRNMHMITGKRLSQCILIVFRPEALQPDIALSIWRLEADMGSALDAASGIFQHL